MAPRATIALRDREEGQLTVLDTEHAGEGAILDAVEIAVGDDVDVEEPLIEEISIDGMCGVY